MKLIKNLLQQIDNSKFFRHNVEKNCRSYFFFKNVKIDLNFDIITNDKYHYKTLNQRKHATQLIDKTQRIFLKKTKLQLKTLIIT